MNAFFQSAVLLFSFITIITIIFHHHHQHHYLFPLLLSPSTSDLLYCGCNFHIFQSFFHTQSRHVNITTITHYNYNFSIIIINIIIIIIIIIIMIKILGEGCLFLFTWRNRLSDFPYRQSAPLFFSPPTFVPFKGSLYET